MDLLVVRTGMAVLREKGAESCRHRRQEADLPIWPLRLGRRPDFGLHVTGLYDRRGGFWRRFISGLGRRIVRR